MKVTELTLFILITLAAALGGWPVQAAEKGSGRGGAGDLIQPVQNDECRQVSRPITCPMCKDADWSGKAASAYRGNKSDCVTEKNICAKCGMNLSLCGTAPKAINSLGKDAATKSVPNSKGDKKTGSHEHH